MDVSVNLIGWNCIIVRESDFRWGFLKYSFITSEFCYALSCTTASQQIWFYMITCVSSPGCQMFALNMRFLRLQWFFVVLIRRDNNLALFLQHLIDMHSEKSKQFIRGPVVNRILGTKGKYNCLEHDYQE